VHVLEKPGTVKSLQTGVYLGFVKMLAGPKLEIGADGTRLNPAVAFNDDGIGARAVLSRRRGMRHAGIKANAPHCEEQADQD
jgi:hypothetical protein